MHATPKFVLFGRRKEDGRLEEINWWDDVATEEVIGAINPVRNQYVGFLLMMTAWDSTAVERR